MSRPPHPHFSAHGVQSVNVLCLDGGGVRGLSSLLILKRLIQKLSAHSPQTSLLPCEIFDIICGTSTGGIIALMLGRLRMSVDEAIRAYLDFSKTAFAKKKAIVIQPTYRYDALKLEDWIKKFVSKRAGGNTSLADPHGCRTFVVAVRQAHADTAPKLFRSYAAKGMPADTCKIWEAARATTAALPFFKPVTVGTPTGVIYVDGQFSGSNNPSQLAIKEVGNIFPSSKIGCLLSLGTGKPSDVVSIPGDERKIAEACEQIIKSCETVHNTTFDDFKLNGRGKGYIRLSVDRGLTKIGLDEWEREAELKDITEGYLVQHEVDDEVKKCIRLLREKVDMIDAYRIT